MKEPAARAYRMSARADAAAETGERILDAVSELFWEQPSDQVSLDAVSRRSGVSVRTVIRRFGGKDGLFAAAAARDLDRTRGEREVVKVGDTAAAVTVLVSHYEDMGDRVLRLLAEEERSAALTGIVERGRELHRVWCAGAFPNALDGLHGVERARRFAQIVAVCDVCTWKLLRRDAGLSRRQTELAIVELIKPLTEER